MDSSVLILDGTVVTMSSDRRVIKDGAVYIENDRIRDVGKASDLKAKHRAETVIDARRKIVLPGLIDCHVHLAQAMIRGCADDVSLISWLKDYVWPLQGNYTPEDGKTSAQLCILEMIKSGTTTFVESLLHTRYGFHGIAQAVQESGIRAVLSKSVMDMPGYATASSIMHPGMIEDGKDSVSEAEAMIQKWHGKADGHIRVWFGLRSLGACTRSLYERVAQLARNYGTGMTMHLCEVREDVEYARREFGMSPVEFAERTGILGPNTILAHVVWVDDSDIRRLGETRTTVSHCPSSNLKLASGFAPIPEMLRAGLNVALGCDGAPSNNCYDMIREMKTAALIHKARLSDPTVMPAETVLEMATVNGAKAIGMEKEIGSIEAGKKADIILVDQKQPHMTPSLNPVSNLVYAACGADVDTVIVDGQIVMESRIVKTIDEELVLQQAEELACEVVRRAGVKLQTRLD